MDNNSPNNPIVQPPLEGGDNNKMVVWLIVGLVVVILVVGAVYWYLSSQQTVSKPAEQAGAKPAAREDLDKELNSINVETLDSDFSLVDQDLKNL